MSYAGYVPRYSPEEQDFSESDCQSDGLNMQQHVSTDFKELYRRKHRVRSHPQNIPPNYYNTHIPSCYEQHNRITTCPCNIPSDRYCYCKYPPKQEGTFKSSTHISPKIRCPESKSSTGAFKKYPVTARTPRFYRQLPAQIVKRPSTLCLPGTCQPDPAVSTRPRKAAIEIQHYHSQEPAFAVNDYIVKTTAIKKTNTRPVDSEGDVNSKLHDLENFLTKFDVDEDQSQIEQMEITGVSDIAKILKPKIPSSIKAKQDKMLKVQTIKTDMIEAIPTSKINKLEVKEAPGEFLEMFLQKLHKEDSLENDGVNNTEVMYETKPEVIHKQRHLFCGEQKPPLDDNSALELHKSKSYIVSLIDKALSKELGTVPGDKCSTKEFLNMSAKKAVNIVNRYSETQKNETGMYVDITAASVDKREEPCTCKKEESLYIKKLKKLRWSHLHHIQREAKRLADLEKFLDTFSDGESLS